MAKTVLFRIWAASLILAFPMASHAIESTVVYIKCTTAGGSVSEGSGVIVSSQGHVLTARHVAPSESSCVGSIGVADPNAASLLVAQPSPVSSDLDATMLRFARPMEYDFAKFCHLEDWMIRKRIFVAGFPGTTKTGVPSYREGILSTVFPTPKGILETDTQTVTGMSGGPVYSRNLAGLLGIVIGAEFAADGTVSYYGLLPVSFFASALNLTPAEDQCYYPKRQKDFTDPDTGDWLATWRTGDAQKSLGVREDQGDCYISGVFGEWNDTRDKAVVELRDGEFVIDGENYGGGQHGVSAKCIMYD